MEQARMPGGVRSQQMDIAKQGSSSCRKSARKKPRGRPRAEPAATGAYRLLEKKRLYGGLPRSGAEKEIKGEPDHAASPLCQVRNALREPKNPERGGAQRQK